MRPYAFKLPAYRYEQEIRFVFGIRPEVAEEASGVLVELDGKTLIQDVLISDLIAKDKARLIHDFFVKVKTGELHSPAYPEDLQGPWRDRLSKFEGTPFTLQDDYPELFPDLTDYL